MGWYTLVSSCPLYPLYGDTGLLAARKHRNSFRAGLSAPFPRARARRPGVEAGRSKRGRGHLGREPGQGWPAWGQGCRYGGPSGSQRPFAQMHCLSSPRAFLQCRLPSPSTSQLRKTLLSANFTSSSALQGQRPRGAHGPSAAVQDGQPPALVSRTPASRQVLGRNSRDPTARDSSHLWGHSRVLTPQHPPPEPPGGHQPHILSHAVPGQVSRTILSSRNFRGSVSDVVPAAPRPSPLCWGPPGHQSRAADRPRGASEVHLLQDDGPAA